MTPPFRGVSPPLISLSVCPDESNACPGARRRNSHFGLLGSFRVLFLFYGDSRFTRNEGVPKYVSQVLIMYARRSNFDTFLIFSEIVPLSPILTLTLPFVS